MASLPPHSAAYPRHPGGSQPPPFPQMLHPARSNSGLPTANDPNEDEDMTPDEEDESQAAAAAGDKPKGKKEAKRRRQVQSCSECRRRCV